MSNDAISQVAAEPRKGYVNVTFSDVEPRNNYNPRNIQIPIGAKIEGNTVKYEITKDGKLIEISAGGDRKEVEEIKLTKPQLAAIEEFASIDDNPDDITPEELENCAKNLNIGIANKLKERKSEYHLMSNTNGATAGDVPVAEACFIPVSEPQDVVCDDSIKKYIFVDLRNCEK